MNSEILVNKSILCNSLMDAHNIECNNCDKTNCRHNISEQNIDIQSQDSFTPPLPFFNPDYRDW